MKLTAASVLLARSVLLSNFSLPQEVRNYLANNTVLIIHHSGKPDTGTGLNAAGEARARLYTKYFQPFQEEGLSIQVDSLYSGADSENSMRPHFTLEPLSKSSGMPLHVNIGTKDSELLVQQLKVEFHGDEIFDWVIVLKMGPDGQLTSAKRIHQSLRVPVSIP